MLWLTCLCSADHLPLWWFLLLSLVWSAFPLARSPHGSGVRSHFLDSNWLSSLASLVVHCWKQTSVTVQFWQRPVERPYLCYRISSVCNCEDYIHILSFIWSSHIQFSSIMKLIFLYMVSYSSLHRFIWDLHTDQLPVG